MIAMVKIKQPLELLIRVDFSNWLGMQTFDPRHTLLQEFTLTNVFSYKTFALQGIIEFSVTFVKPREFPENSFGNKYYLDFRVNLAVSCVKTKYFPFLR